MGVSLRACGFNSKGPRFQTYGEITANFSLCFNKTTPTQDTLRKLWKVKSFETDSVLGVKRSGLPHKCLGVSTRVEKSGSSVSHKSPRRNNLQNSDPQNFHAMCDKKIRLCLLSDRSYQQFKWQLTRTCGGRHACLLRTLRTLVSHRNAYVNAKSRESWRLAQTKNKYFFLKIWSSLTL